MKTKVLGLLFIAIAVTGCLNYVPRFATGRKISGTYGVADMDKTLSGIKAVPRGAQEGTTLAGYREQIRKEYTGKTLVFGGGGHGHNWLLEIPLEGAVGGFLHGGWTRNPTQTNVVLIYQWVSDVSYSLWGRATYANGVWAVKLDDDGPTTLYLKKRGLW